MLSNKGKGDKFADRVGEYLRINGFDVEREYSVQISINSQFTNGRKFDLGNESLLVECKRYTWGKNNPSGKFSTANEALLYFLAAPESYRKMLFMAETGRNDKRNQETMAEHYVRSYNHLFPEKLEVFELNEESLSARRLWPRDGTAKAEPDEMEISSQQDSNEERVGDNQVFHLTLQPSYSKKGFFNIGKDFNDLVPEDGPVSLVLTDGGKIETKVTRTADNNGTPRTNPKAALRDWFKNYSVGDIIPVRFDKHNRQIYLG